TSSCAIGMPPSVKIEASLEWHEDTAKNPTLSSCHARQSPFFSARSFLAADLRLEPMLEAILDFLVGLVHFLVGERAILGLVRQRIGEALGPCRDALAAVEVEQPHAAQQIA